MNGNNLDRWRDAKLLVDALRHEAPGSTRHDFVLRLRRSFHQFGGLTASMREALRPTLTASSSG
jgi:hypothetical protein